jgi:hypothetical protein
MAVTVTPAYAGTYTKSWNIIASADTDVAAVIPHGFGAIPKNVVLVPLLANAYVSTWTVGVVDATNINLVKANAVGSGNVAAQVQVVAQLPHSIVA